MHSYRSISLHNQGQVPSQSMSQFFSLPNHSYYYNFQLFKERKSGVLKKTSKKTFIYQTICVIIQKSQL